MKKSIIGLLSACFLMACFSGTAMAAEAGNGQESAPKDPASLQLFTNESGQDGAMHGQDGEMRGQDGEMHGQDGEMHGQDGEMHGQEYEDGSGENSENAEIPREDPPSVEGIWEEDGEDWRYALPDGTHLSRGWLRYKGHWYYFFSDGYMAMGSAKIGGKYYYFQETGEMAVGWAYDSEEDKWYYLEEDGAKKTGWLQAGGDWYWFDSRGEMYNEGFRMVSGHKYYFFSNGQLAADKYVGLYYYNSDGLRDRQYDMVIQGKRKPTEEEKDGITKAMENIPGEWVKKFVESGWEFMFYTDKNYFSAPSTDQGIYYVYHKTDTNYKKLKFTKPESLALAFGEYIAHETDNDEEENVFMADYQQYLAMSSLVQPLPSYFDSWAGMWFGSLFEAYIRPEVRYDMKWESPELARFMEKTLGIDTEGRKPSVEELEDRLLEEYGFDSNGIGPSEDEELGKHEGPGEE